MSRNLIAIVFVLVPASIVTLASDYAYPRLPDTCETGEIVALRSAAHRGPTAPGIADDQFRLAVAIEEAARHCPTGKEDGLHEAYGWYGTAGAKNHAEAAYRAALYEWIGPAPDHMPAWRSSILLRPTAMQRHKRGSRCAISRALASSETSRTDYSFSFVPHL
jgi:hypothetical protein